MFLQAYSMRPVNGKLERVSVVACTEGKDAEFCLANLKSIFRKAGVPVIFVLSENERVEIYVGDVING